jgi:hypothetical protein
VLENDTVVCHYCYAEADEISRPAWQQIFCTIDTGECYWCGFTENKEGLMDRLTRKELEEIEAEQTKVYHDRLLAECIAEEAEFKPADSNPSGGEAA